MNKQRHPLSLSLLSFQGAILVFLPGWQDIKAVYDKLQDTWPSVSGCKFLLEIVCLYFCFFFFFFSFVFYDDEHLCPVSCIRGEVSKQVERFLQHYLTNSFFWQSEKAGKEINVQILIRQYSQNSEIIRRCWIAIIQTGVPLFTSKIKLSLQWDIFRTCCKLYILFIHVLMCHMFSIIFCSLF